MCAISGILGLPATDQTISRMLQTMHRRGPDGQGVYRKEKTTLLHTRLAIIDPAGGAQPMALEWEGETYCLVYNGELYNTQELRRELKAKGHRFSGHSDTEVVLHAYAQYGETCVNRFNGIFAMAVWEEKAKRLFLARDRIGVKPLFYKMEGTGLLFASEIKTILTYPGVQARLSVTGAAQLLLLGPGRIPGSGILDGIREVEPGCCGWWEGGKLRLRRYWRLTDREHKETFDETCECVRYLVTDAIKRQMVSDVPIGTFLSGGLDSSIITAVCAGEMAKGGERLKTFSVDYRDNDRNFRANKFQPEPDAKYIRMMTDALGTDHRNTELTSRLLLDTLEDATIARDLPGMADVDFSLLAFCGDVRQDVKVALSGECADEIFGGYPWYRDPQVRAAQGFPWAQNTHERGSLLPERIKINATDYVLELANQTCRESDILPETSGEERRMKEMVNLNFRWFMQTLLDRKDRMSMYQSLEVRVPFCDYRIAEYLYGVPWEMKDYQGREKGLLRSSVGDLLPEPVLHRKKSPYPKTFDPSFASALQEQVAALLRTRSPVWELFSRENVTKLLETESSWPWYGQLMRRPQLMAYILQTAFWLNNYQVDLCF